MTAAQGDPIQPMETTCGTLLYELQIIWDEVGESDAERDKMLYELEQECLEVYRRKVDQANKSRAQLRQAIADSEAELAAICSAMGERPVHIRQSDQSLGGLKAELRTILPELNEMRSRKSDRKKQFIEVTKQIQKIRDEIFRPSGCSSTTVVVDESDLSLRKLEELHAELQALQKEKTERLKQVLDHLSTLNSLCSVLGIDFKQTVNDVHPSLGESEGTKNISNDTIQHLAAAIGRLREVKLLRMQQLQDLASSMLELWNLMDTPIEEQQKFQNVTCMIAASEHEIIEPNILSVEFIYYVEGELSRLEELKASKMKELVLKKRSELEEICRRTHMVADVDNAVDGAIEAMESGVIDAASILEQIELQIAQVKEEAFSRKEILDKMEKWIAACEEECWLEEYNRDENRYNAGRGAHLTLKRAEKARTLVNKIPALVDALTSKTKAWESERGIDFNYDGIRLLAMLEEYNILQQEKEEERKRQRDQKKLQGQLMAEHEAIYGSKPSPLKNQSAKKGRRMSCSGVTNRRLSVGGTMLQSPKLSIGGTMPKTLKPEFQTNKATPNTHKTKKSDLFHQRDQFNHSNDDGLPALSSGRKGLDLAGLPLKKQSNTVNGCEIEKTMTRKPFSPISSTDSSMFNATNILEDLTRKHNEMVNKMLPSSHNPLSTPVKTYTTEEENRTPVVVPPIPVPSTPSTVSAPMQTAVTPAHNALVPYNSKPVEEIPQEIEYSFEERRLGFLLFKT
ncbi:65-kDa microtubule-associated protein 3 [Capsicum annuum]|uniref:65-kDa microtubule-associated protein 3 n=1 Tax=Capsicum annuum TaxID=4072 RepID=A0A2G2ZYR6_CAPAN|nr:65-kDa microtubule-associated protein 3-like [Capsicum annuum]XP_047264470.1 65-kDa microtubule-associated protein 3-like [Capsicum annuum]KAF3637253.1 65-kDa microtubule-associated protein 3 [Capsicum annuum]PHT87123.1 65-kDa microtubule-associated protein 3 [Capsicum annuum]